MKSSIKLRESVKRSTIFAERPEDIDFNRLKQVLTESTFAIIKGLIGPKAIRHAKSLFRGHFESSRDHAATGEDPRQLMDNFQKLSIGGAEHSGTYRPRCMRTLYNPIWADDIYCMRESFTTMAIVRNILYGKPIDYAIANIDEGFWTASRIHHYPAGGGFLMPHVDNIVPTVQKAEGLPLFFQPVLVMSKKGDGEDCDFITGGGFFEVASERYYYEADCELGDIVIYSGRTIHGVADIDLHIPFDSTSSRGRLAGFVTLYKEFKIKGELDKYVSRTRTVY
jgi:hypothetical protein